MHIPNHHSLWLAARACLSLVVLMAVASLTGTAFAADREAVTTEYKIKSALLYKFTRFVEWPKDLIPKATDFKICVLGQDEFGSTLDALEGRKAHGLPIRIQRFKLSAKIDTSCRLVFITRHKQIFLQSILEQLDPYPILTVGDSDSFADQGGMVQFVIKNKKISFRINNVRANACKLHIAAPLLQMSTIVEGNQSRGRS